jgi:hypothetical protein
VGGLGAREILALVAWEDLTVADCRRTREHPVGGQVVPTGGQVISPVLDRDAWPVVPAG